MESEMSQSILRRNHSTIRTWVNAYLISISIALLLIWISTLAWVPTWLTIHSEATPWLVIVPFVSAFAAILLSGITTDKRLTSRITKSAQLDDLGIFFKSGAIRYGAAAFIVIVVTIVQGLISGHGTDSALFNFRLRRYELNNHGAITIVTRHVYDQVLGVDVRFLAGLGLGVCCVSLALIRAFGARQASSLSA